MPADADSSSGRTPGFDPGDAGSSPASAAEPTLDADGSPSEASLAAICSWKLRRLGQDAADLLAFVHLIWKWADGSGWRGWVEESCLDDLDKPTRRYYLSTGGWSGNESLIAALQDNRMFWSLCWQQTRRGGHYIFEVRK